MAGTTRESIAAAAARNGVSPQTIRLRIRSGELTGYRFGPRMIRVDPDEVDALFQPIPDAGSAA